MSFKVLEPMPLMQLERISPTSFLYSSQCKLKLIWTMNSQPFLLPRSPAAFLGTIIHKMFENANKGKIKDEASIKSGWNQEIKNIEESIKNNSLEKHLVPLSQNAHNYKVKKLMSFKMIRSLTKNYTKRTLKSKEYKKESEVWLETSDKKIVGKIDLVKKTDSGVELVEYKTGLVLDQKSPNVLIKQEYLKQIKLYAALYYSAYKIWPIRLTLIGINQKEYDIPFDKNECSNLLKTAKSQINDINELIISGLDHKDFSEPSPESCKYCLYRPACKSYWENRKDSLEWPIDKIGKVIEKKILGNGLGRIVLENDGKSFAIRNLSLERYDFFNSDFENVLFCNLGPDTSEGFFVEKILTTGFML